MRRNLRRRRHRHRYKNKLIFTLLILFTLSISVGYAIFTQQLTINNTISYVSMKYNVGFTNIEDNGGTVLSTGSISKDGKSITLNCDFGTSRSQESCSAKLTITNNSAFHVGISGEPIIEYDDTYVNTLTLKWNNHPTFLNTTVHENGFIAQGKTEEVILTIKSKFLNDLTLPAQSVSTKIKVSINFIQWAGEDLPETKNLAILPSMGCKSSGELIKSILDETEEEFNVVCTEKDEEEFGINPYIKTLTFEKGKEIPQDIIDDEMYIELTDNITVYAYTNEEYTTDTEEFYDIYINSKDQLYANEDMAYYFAGLTSLEKINGLELLDTSMTTNMEGIFVATGADSPKINLDFSSLDTSNVTNMKLAFALIGIFSDETAEIVTKNINISSLDTSNVKDASYMFAGTGLTFLDLSALSEIANTENITENLDEVIDTEEPSQIVTTDIKIDISQMDTSNITNMEGMFVGTGGGLPDFALDLSNFETRKTTNLIGTFAGIGVVSKNLELDFSNITINKNADTTGMFALAGAGSTNFNLKLTGMDTSEATDMLLTFAFAGILGTDFTLDLRGIDTSKVQNMEGMFAYALLSCTNCSMDLSTIDTSKVTNMEGMFAYAGVGIENFELDLSNFNTSKVTNMSSMFESIANDNTEFELDLSNFDTRNVTDMSNMFKDACYSCSTFTLNVSNFDTSKVTNMSGMFNETGYQSTNFILDVSNFNTQNVTNMREMFYETGYNSENFMLDVSNFDTSNVTDTSDMFYYTGYNSTKLNTSITIKNPNTTTYYRMFQYVATKQGSQIRVNYTNETSELVDQMIATKYYVDSNVVKGHNIDNIVTFTINNQTYTGYEGMKWDDWVKSNFNTNKEVELVDNRIKFNQQSIYRDENVYITPTERIIANRQYYYSEDPIEDEIPVD